MKTWTLRFRAVDKDNFEDVRSGVKSIETRAASVKYKPIQEGDILIFVCGKDKFSKTITKKYHFKSIDEMFKKISFKKIMPDLDSKEDAEARYYSYPNYKEKIEEFGILAFELK